MGTNEIIKLAVSGVAAALLFVLRSFFAGKNPKDGTGKKKKQKENIGDCRNCYSRVVFHRHADISFFKEIVGA